MYTHTYIHQGAVQRMQDQLTEMRAQGGVQRVVEAEEALSRVQIELQNKVRPLTFEKFHHFTTRNCATLPLQILLLAVLQVKGGSFLGSGRIAE